MDHNNYEKEIHRKLNSKINGGQVEMTVLTTAAG